MYNRQDIAFGNFVISFTFFSSTDFCECHHHLALATNPSLIKCDRKKEKIKIILKLI